MKITPELSVSLKPIGCLKGELFNFWGGLNEVVDVRVDFERDQNKLEAIQIVTVMPYWTQNELNLTPELLWKDSQIIDK